MTLELVLGFVVELDQEDAVGVVELDAGNVSEPVVPVAAAEKLLPETVLVMLDGVSGWLVLKRVIVEVP